MVKLVRRLVVGLALLGAVAAAGAMGAEVAYALGEVNVSQDGNTVEAVPSLVLHRGDIIRTGADGTAVIRMDDGTELKLRENTTLAMETLDEPVTVHLASGSLFSRVTKRVTGAYRVRTQTAVAGVRGTEFFVAFGRLIDAQPDLWLCVNEGSVDVTLEETGDRVVVNQGEGISIVGGVKLTRPRFYPWTTKLNWNFDPGDGFVRDRTSLDQAYSDLLDQDYD